MEVKHEKLLARYPEIASDSEEELVADVHKHWIGYVSIWGIGFVSAGLLLLLTVALLFFAGQAGIKFPGYVMAIIGLVALVVAALILVGSAISAWVYGQSTILITNENIIEIKQTSLFSRKIAHLNMINVEDVSVRKEGILPTLLNYGGLSVQTAGETENFNFTNTPDPNTYRRYIIEAHEDAVARAGNAPNTAAWVQVSNNNL
jgi:hypothetical protein